MFKVSSVPLKNSMTDELQNVSTSIASPPGISGKRLTVWVLVGLAIIGVSLSTTLWTYNQLDVARRESTVAWRGVAEHLSGRYRAAERTVASGVGSRELKMEFGEKFRLAIDAFRTTSLPEEQLTAAERVENLLASSDYAPWIASLPASPDEMQAAIADYNLARQRESILLESWGGRVLDIFLKFDPPRPFALETAIEAPSDRSAGN